MSNGRKPTLRDVRKQRGQSDFVGRSEELVFFERNLALPADDERRKYLINIAGQSGVGKTTLLKHYQRMAEKMGAVTAWTDHDDQDAVWVMGSVYNQLSQSRVAVPAFEDEYNRYLARLKEQEVQGGQPKCLFAFAGTIAKAAFRLGKLNAKAKPALDLIDEDTVIAEAKELVTRELREEDYDLLTSPREVLTPLFLDALEQFAEQGSVVVFFDTYEVTGQYLEPWLLDIFDFNKYGDVPANLTVVIAGQSELDPIAWERHAWLIERLSLAEFSEQEARAYLVSRGITEESQIRRRMDSSGRLPALLALLATSKVDAPSDVIDLSDTAVKRILKGIDDPGQRSIVLDASVARRLDRDVIAALIGDEDADAVFDWLKQRRLIVKHHTRWAYHDVVRSLMVRQRREESSSRYRQTHLKLAAHYDVMTRTAGNGSRAGTEEYASEALYHHMCGAPSQDKYQQGALSAFARAFGRNPASSRLWASAIQQAGEDAPDTRLRTLGSALAKAVNHYEEKQYGEAAAALRRAAETASAERSLKAKLLGNAALLFALARQYTEAEAVLNRALEYAPNDMVLLTEQVHLYRLWGRSADALRALDAAGLIDPHDFLLGTQGLLLTIQLGRKDLTKFEGPWTGAKGPVAGGWLHFAAYLEEIVVSVHRSQAQIDILKGDFEGG